MRPCTESGPSIPESTIVTDLAHRRGGATCSSPRRRGSAGVLDPAVTVERARDGLLAEPARQLDVPVVGDGRVVDGDVTLVARRTDVVVAGPEQPEALHARRGEAIGEVTIGLVGHSTVSSVGHGSRRRAAPTPATRHLSVGRGVEGAQVVQRCVGADAHEHARDRR